jgi:hypothetical protein
MKKNNYIKKIAVLILLFSFIINGEAIRIKAMEGLDEFIYDSKTKTLYCYGWSEFYNLSYKKEICPFEKEIKHVVISKGITTLHSLCFKDFYSLETVEMPETIKVIEFGAFQNCLSLKEIFFNVG